MTISVLKVYSAFSPPPPHAHSHQIIKKTQQDFWSNGLSGTPHSTNPNFSGDPQATGFAKKRLCWARPNRKHDSSGDPIATGPAQPSFFVGRPSRNNHFSGDPKIKSSKTCTKSSLFGFPNKFRVLRQGDFFNDALAGNPTFRVRPPLGCYNVKGTRNSIPSPTPPSWATSSMFQNILPGPWVLTGFPNTPGKP